MPWVRELSVLHAERQRSARGELRVALILGEAGLGKTWLAGELLPRDDESAVGLIAQCSAFRRVPPLGPWAAALGQHDGSQGGDAVCLVCGGALGGLAALVRRAESSHDTSVCTDFLRHYFIEWLPGLLAKVSAARPIVVVLDDAHLSHDVVWEMLLRLVLDFPTSSLFVVATARPAELAEHRVAVEVLHILEQQARLRRVQLAPLSSDDVRELAAELLRQDSVPSALVDWLVARAQGNPRFTVGLLEALVDSGADLQAPVLRSVPEKLARWVRAEMARLPPLARALAELLAVGGDLLDLGDLARIIGAPLEDIALALERLVYFRIVVECQHDRSLRHKLAHPLAHEVLYTDIGRARLRVIQRQIADTLLESGRTEAAAQQLDRAARAGDREAIDALIELAQQAVRRGLRYQVWKAVVRLRDLLSIGDERWLGVFDVLCQRSTWSTLDRSEHHVAEIAAVRQLRQLLAGIDDLQRQAEVRLWLAELLVYGSGDLDTGQRECQHALALSQQAGSDATARLAAIELAKMRGWAGDLRGEELAARTLLDEAERVGDQRGIVQALGALGYALGAQGRFEACEDALTRAIEIATAAHHTSWASQGLALLASYDASRGHLRSARTRWAQAAASSPRYDPVIGGSGALIELLAGDMTMVTAHIQRAKDHDPSAQGRMPVRLAGCAVIAAVERGCLTEARAILDAMACTDTRTLGVLEPLYWWAHGLVAMAEGQLAAASAALHRAVERFSAMNTWAMMGFLLVDLAEVAVAAGDLDAAARAAGWAEDSARRTGAPIHQTLHLLATAREMIERDRCDHAARVAAQAIEEFSSRGYTLLAARARVAYAHAVRRSDRSAAEDALREAAAAFDACGAIMRHEQVLKLLGQISSGNGCIPAAGPGSGSLTRRERQVAELAAAGYTAVEIATRLHIGVRTVETHLARSYPKLGVTSKYQLQHRAAEFGFTRGP